jgi:hypothetical protein
MDIASIKVQNETSQLNESEHRSGFEAIFKQFVQEKRSKIHTLQANSKRPQSRKLKETKP